MSPLCWRETGEEAARRAGRIPSCGNEKAAHPTMGGSCDSRLSGNGGQDLQSGLGTLPREGTRPYVPLSDKRPRNGLRGYSTTLRLSRKALFLAALERMFYNRRVASERGGGKWDSSRRGRRYMSASSAKRCQRKFPAAVHKVAGRQDLPRDGERGRPVRQPGSTPTRRRARWAFRMSSACSSGATPRCGGCIARCGTWRFLHAGM